MPERFHAQFRTALSGDEAALSPWCAGAQTRAGLSVYCNSIAKGCADALAAQFPTVERVVGPAWLAAAAIAHAGAHPPRSATLLSYGAAFPDWLAAFPPASGMPFLTDLAQLDWLWTLAHLAADAEPLDAAEVRRFSPDAFAEYALVVHPAAQWAGFETTVPSLWRALSFLAPTAVRLLQLRELARIHPEYLAYQLLPPELVALVARLAGVRVPAQMTMGDFWSAVARPALRLWEQSAIKVPTGRLRCREKPQPRQPVVR